MRSSGVALVGVAVVIGRRVLTCSSLTGYFSEDEKTQNAIFYCVLVLSIYLAGMPCSAFPCL